MKFNSKLSLALVSMCALTNAFAVPTIYPTKVTRLSEIQNQTNSNIISDSDDEKVFWVMPPNSGTSDVKGLHTITANVGFCKEMSDLQGYSRETVQRINDLMIQEKNAQNKVDAKLNELTSARQDLAQYVVTSRLEDLEHIDLRVDSIEIEIKSLSDQLLTCKQFCNTLASQISALKTEKREEVLRRRDIVARSAFAARAYERKKSAVEGIIADLQSMDEAWNNLKTKLTTVHNLYLEIYSSFAKMEGARAAILFDNKWDTNVSSLREKNPGFSFQKIQTQDAVITTSIANLASIPSGGAIMSYDVGGSVTDGKLMLPSYPENMTGNVRLSLLGACPILHPDYFDINLPNGSDVMKYGMTVSYEYPTAFVASAKATYNMHKLYEKIMKSGSKGGWFSSRSWSSIEEKTYFKDEFNVEWKEQDASNSYTEAEKAELEKEMRNQIFGRLAAIGLPTVSNPGELVAPTLPVSGAVVLGNSLENNKLCQSNVYCVAAGIGVKTLAAIFGSNSSSASYTNTQDVNMTESWSREKVVFKPWISSYR
jgi:hypothetical protein